MPAMHCFGRFGDAVPINLFPHPKTHLPSEDLFQPTTTHRITLPLLFNKHQPPAHHGSIMTNLPAVI
jgi:hypothetical protein